MDRPLQYWSTNPEITDLNRGRLALVKSITPDDVRKAVATYIADEGDWSMLVLPEKKYSIHRGFIAEAT